MSTAAPPVPDLADMPADPPTVPASYNEWSLDSMGNYLTAMDSRKAYYHAATAAQRQAQGIGHMGVMLALGAAETAAPAGERPWHAARLDAYAAAYGLRGWYRYTMRCAGGGHAVQVNKLRTPEDGDRGRYYVSTTMLRRPHVVDRDTGRIVADGFADSKAADAWITAAEAGPADAAA